MVFLLYKEIEEIYEFVECLKVEGKVILFISYKFDEIFCIVDCYMVFCDGQMVGVGKIVEVFEQEFVKFMVGCLVDQVFLKCILQFGEEILKVVGYLYLIEFEDIGFMLCFGEIFGFYGFVGVGCSEFMQVFFGIIKLFKGVICIDDQIVVICDLNEVICCGIVYVLEDWGKQGVIKGLLIFQNVFLLLLKEILWKGFLRLVEEFKFVWDYMQWFDLCVVVFDQDIGEFFGGNQQKVVIVKWLVMKFKVIILDEFIKGIDIGFKVVVYEFMVELVVQGFVVIMVFLEILEIFGMLDWVIVMWEGCIVVEYDGMDLILEYLVCVVVGILEVCV